MSSSNPLDLRRVSNLTITFLVDNNIEWMTKLPTGFTHELQQHVPLSHRAPSGAPGAGVPVLNFDDFCCGAHGFAALIETEPVASDRDVSGSSEGGRGSRNERHYTLFDTGPDSISLVRNVRALQVPITMIDRVVTSHWHSDHTGGLLSFLELRKKCGDEGLEVPPPTSELPTLSRSRTADGTGKLPAAQACVVDVHPSRPHLRGIAPPAMGGKVLCALPPDPTFDAITERGGTLETNGEGHTVAGGTVWISGEVPRVTEWEEGLPGSVRWVKRGEKGWVEDEIGDEAEVKDEKWVPEPHIMDERYAVVDVEGKGLVVFSSCSHAGIVNVIKDAVETFNRPIYMIVGGLHLASAELYPRIEPTVSFFSTTLRPSPAYILPMHCTGWKAKIALEEALGEGVVPAGVGHKVEIIGVKEEGMPELWVQMKE